jgi:hypothetical protein
MDELTNRLALRLGAVGQSLTPLRRVGAGDERTACNACFGSGTGLIRRKDASWLLKFLMK